MRHYRPRWLLLTLAVASLSLIATVVAPLPIGTVPGPFVRGALQGVGNATTLGPEAVRTPLPSLNYTTQSVRLPAEPVALAVDAAESDLDVATSANNVTVVGVDNDTILANVSLPSGGTASFPTAETYASAPDYVYVGGYETGLCLGCDGPWIAAIDGATDRVVATNTSLEGIDVPDYIGCMGYASVTAVAYACDNPSKLLVLNSALDEITGSDRVGSTPSSMVVDPGNMEIYVTNAASNNVTVLRQATGSMVSSVAVGADPLAIAYDSGVGALYVANNGSDNVSVILDTSNEVVATIPVGCGPDGIAYDPAASYVLVTDSCSNNLTVISDSNNRVVGSIPLGTDPVAIVPAPLADTFYVANHGSSSLSEVEVTPPPPTDYPIEFEESGLAPGTEWTIEVGVTEVSSFTPAIGFSIPNGTYMYTVSTDPPFTPYHPYGRFSVTGVGYGLVIGFGRWADFWIHVNGLPSDVTWSYDVANSTMGINVFATSLGSGSVAVEVYANFTYSYSVNFPENDSALDRSGNTSVGPNGTSITIDAGGGSSNSVPLSEIVGIGVIVLAAAVTVAVMLKIRRKPPEAPTTPPPSEQKPPARPEPPTW